MRKFLIILALILLPVPVLAAPVKISSNGVYSWWNHNIAQGDYYTAINNQGIQRVFLNDNSNYFDLADIGADDHNAPSILSRTGHPTIVFYPSHGTRTTLPYRIAPEGTIAFGSERLITFPYRVSYSQILDYGDTLVVFTRSGAGKWQYVISQDDGETWTTPQMFIDTLDTGRHYELFTESESTPGLYHFAIAQNPGNALPHYINYGTLDLRDGTVNSFFSNRGNIYTPAGLPLQKEELDEINPIQNNDQKVRLLDVGEKYGVPVIYYAKWGGGTTSQYYKAIQNTDGTWARSKLNILTGKEISPPHPRHYIGGVSLDRNGNNILYVSSESNGTWTIKKYDLDTNLNQINPVTLASSTYPLARPYSVKGEDAVIYQELRKYNSFKDYLAYVWKWSF